MVAVPPHSIGPRLADVRGNATEFRLSVRATGPVVWCTLIQVTRAPRGGYDVYEQVDRWAVDNPRPHGRMTRERLDHLLAECVLQRRIPGVD